MLVSNKKIINTEKNMNKRLQKSWIYILFFTIPYINIAAKAMTSLEDIEEQIGTVAISTEAPSKKVRKITRILGKKVGMVDGEEGDVFDVYEAKNQLSKQEYLNSMQEQNTILAIMTNFYFENEENVGGNLKNSIRKALGFPILKGS